MKEGGIEVRLPDGMCLDRHVPDFLQCLRCWLWHERGDPRITGNPWRIRCLDLSGNGLADESAAHVFEQLQSLDLRIERLCLRGNAIEAKGLDKIAEYIWNCQDPVLELDLASNQIEAESVGSSCGDPVSALLRCLYNHPAYPQMVTSQSGRIKAVPLTLRLGGNKVKEPARLLKAVQAKAGKHRVQIRSKPDPYEQKSEEFLSVCLPDLLEQTRSSSRDRTRKRRRSASAHTPKRVILKPAPGASKSLEVDVKSEKIEKEKKVEKASKSKKEKKEKKVKRNSPAKKEEPEHWRPAAEHRSESENSANSAVANPKDADICDELGAKAPALLIPESEVKALQEEINRKIGKFAALPKEESSREMLSEFVVCMAIAGKGGKEIERELAPFLADEAKNFVKWFGKHIQRFKKS